MTELAEHLRLEHAEIVYTDPQTADRLAAGELQLACCSKGTLLFAMYRVPILWRISSSSSTATPQSGTGNFELPSVMRLARRWCRLDVAVSWHYAATTCKCSLQRTKPADSQLNSSNPKLAGKP